MSDFGALKDYIRAGSIKRLSPVECDPSRSNQHELNGVLAMRSYLGAERREYPATFLRLEDESEDIDSWQGTVTWYDAREGHPTRSEFRFYYQDNPAILSAKADDPLAVILKKDGAVLIVSAPAESQSAVILTSFFDDDVGDTFNIFDFSNQVSDLSLSQRFLMEEIGIEIEADFGADYLTSIEKQFGSLKFPTTADFSTLARDLAGGFDAHSCPDDALITFWDTEEAMFRQLENHHIDTKLFSGFFDADDFLAFSQTIRQRRSSRAGHALENHLAALFDYESINYSWGMRTEGNKRPDFIFPGVKEYKDSNYPETNLMMLGVKTTCKDRWRQVLSEADRISKKHLLTLQPKISENQTREMRSVGLQLVVPAQLHTSFTANQQSWLLSLGEFIALARRGQS